MQRIGFTIQVKTERLEEYLGIHAAVWPELVAELKVAGMRNYSLWMGPGGLEFGYLECDDWQATCEYLAKSEVHARWQEFMKDFLVSRPEDGAGGQPVKMLEMAFLLD